MHAPAAGDLPKGGDNIRSVGEVGKKSKDTSLSALSESRTAPLPGGLRRLSPARKAGPRRLNFGPLDSAPRRRGTIMLGRRVGITSVQLVKAERKPSHHLPNSRCSPPRRGGDAQGAGEGCCWGGKPPAGVEVENTLIKNILWENHGRTGQTF